MKNKLFLVIITVLVLVSCNQKSKKVKPESTPVVKIDSISKDKNSKIYSCSMHPEVHGKLDAKCSKCGMKLTVEVK
jgi:hypothetical protein